MRDLDEVSMGRAMVLRSAVRLQQLVPDAVSVSSSTGVPCAHLEQRLGAVLDALESDPEWVFNRANPGKVILSELGGIEAGVRQMIRTVPLEVEEVTLAGGSAIRVPTAEESVRIKAWLIVRRNQVRDYLDVAALSGESGVDWAATTLRGIDTYYADANSGPDSVASQVVRQLSDPRPKDLRTTPQLSGYKGLRRSWTDWDRIVLQCRAIADAMSLGGVRHDTPTSELRFRNLNVTYDDPVEAWGVEGILTAIDRGALRDWSRIVDAVRADPNGSVAHDLSEAVEIAEDHGVVALMRRALG
ncbi:hypothetical protein P5V97_24410 [Mycobacteroides abscessus subsp. massiliense]|uniref:hypothetical protein n=1 Tax=Mycobacteroides abscessus TaxID=36809 RepID=UPI00266B7323|nr:hypothetical protein [Mycobacteroides abscessus]MDO2992632.1 hypothetical protein [Mycobacteroides abscessus subsp. massiliense]